MRTAAISKILSYNQYDTSNHMLANFNGHKTHCNFILFFKNHFKQDTEHLANLYFVEKLGL